jgi:hypothetical protein
MKRIPSTYSKGFSRQAWPLIGVGIVLAVSALYLGGAVRCPGFGFPLDDAWIHQAYARNLAQSGRLALASEAASVGSTSPLWTALLALGYILGLAPHPWSTILGVSFWLLTAWTGMVLTRRLSPGQRSVAPWVGLACLLEWHLAWAAFSGMEITLAAFLSLWLLERYASRAHAFALGAIGGLLILARPEGIVLVALLALALVIEGLPAPRRPGRTWRRIVSALADLSAGLALLLVPYLILNVVVSGQPLPNTFYAKQAEYRALLAQPIWARLWDVVRQPLIGAQVLLIPGFVWQAFSALRWAVREGQARGVRASRTADEGDEARTAVRTLQQDADPVPEPPSVVVVLLPLTWWAAYHLLYALRLPVSYQHGRYLMPVLPILLAYGLLGTAHWLRRWRVFHTDGPAVTRVLGRALALALAVLFLAFLLLGARAYTDDTCIIQCEMVDVALWLRDHTPPGALVAAHDIGAIGYFSQRPLLDLAGLVTPQVIPVMRDEERLLEFILEQDARYLVTFPSWYPAMIAEGVAEGHLEFVIQTNCPVTRQKGGDNMAVYRVVH